MLKTFSVIILGLTILVIADWEYSSFPPCYQKRYYDWSQDHEYNECPFLHGPVGVSMRAVADIVEGHHDALLVIETFFIALFTFTLWKATDALRDSTEKLWEAGERQIAIVAKATDAAMLNAQAAIATGRAYISGGGGAEPNGTTFRFDVNNYGKTPGDLIEIRCGFISMNNSIPSEPPAYEGLHFHYDWIKPYTWKPGVHTIDVPANIANPAIYGRFYYRDVFNKSHSSGFILSIFSSGQTRPIRAPAIYSREQDEDDPDENLSYHV